MAQEWDALIEAIDSLGQLVADIHKSEYAMYVLTLSILCFLLVTILKVVLKKIPIFSEGEDVNKYGNIVAWCISLLSILGIGWNMWQQQGQTVNGIVNSLISPYGSFIIIFFTMAAAYAGYSNAKDFAKWPKIAWTLIPGITVFFFMYGYTSGNPELASVFLIVCAIVFVFGLIMRAWRGNHE